MKTPIIAVAAALAKIAVAATGDVITTEVNGLSWTYQITSEENKTASLCYSYSDYIEGVVNIPKNIDGYTLTQIDEAAFDGFSSVTEFIIPDSITTIGDNAFDTCTSLKSLIIPKSVTSIGYEAFIGCSELSTIYILGPNVTIGDGAFDFCYELTNIYADNEATKAHIAEALDSAGLSIKVKSLTKFDAGCESFMTKLSPPTAPGGKWQITAFASVAEGDADGMAPANVRVLCGSRPDAIATDVHAKLTYVTNAVMVRLEFDRPDESVNYLKVNFGY